MHRNRTNTKSLGFAALAMALLFSSVACRHTERVPWNSVREIVSGWKPSDVSEAKLLTKRADRRTVVYECHDRPVLEDCYFAFANATRPSDTFKKGGKGSKLTIKDSSGRSKGISINVANAKVDFGPAMEKCVDGIMRGKGVELH